MIHVAGITYVLAGEAAEHLGPDVTAQMVRQWGARRMANRYRVGRVTYYSLDELTEVEYVTRSSARGRPRGQLDQ